LFELIRVDAETLEAEMKGNPISLQYLRIPLTSLSIWGGGVTDGKEIDQKMIDAALERERTREKARIMNIKHEIFTVGG
jgi:hypothetical protein